MPEEQQEEKIEFAQVDDTGEEFHTEEVKEETPPDKTTQEKTTPEKDLKDANIPGISEFIKERGGEPPKIEITEQKKEERKKEGRDFSDIAEEDKPLFQNMSNDAFNKLKPIYLEHKTLKGEVESLKTAKPKDIIYGHPKAYILTPEYEKHTRNAELSDRVLKHWQLQLAKIRRGEAWKDLDLNEKGQFLISEDKEATAESEAEVLQYLHDAQEQAFKFKKNLSTFVESYGNDYNEDLKIIQAAEEKYFPGYKDEKHPTNAVQKAVIAALPISFRSSPLASLLAMTAANNAILLGQLKKVQDELNKIKGIKEDVEKAPLKSNNFLHGSKTTREVKFSDYRAERDN